MEDNVVNLQEQQKRGFLHILWIKVIQFGLEEVVEQSEEGLQLQVIASTEELLQSFRSGIQLLKFNILGDHLQYVEWNDLGIEGDCSAVSFEGQASLKVLGCLDEQRLSYAQGSKGYMDYDT